jgi:starch phosphorylase
VKALRRFTVRAHLPDRIAALAQLSTNLRWSWDTATQELFAGIDPEQWARVGRDPVALLGEVRPGRLDELAVDQGFLERLDHLAADLNEYLTKTLWYQELQAQADAVLPTGIGYFSMEFGVAEVLPIYSGGLGILAGDHLKAASDLGLPLIGVGLNYRSGYFRQSLSADGWQHENYPALDPQGLPLRLLTRPHDDSPVLVELAMPESRVLRARIWVAQVGRIPLLLLDSDIPENDHDMRHVTDRLYGGDQDHRIKQELLAGIGGVRAIRAYTAIAGLPSPDVFHMNEGHAGFLGLERIREYVQGDHLDFDTALAIVRASTLFTTHTPVPAGIDRFPLDMVERYFGGGGGGDDGGGALLPGVGVERVLHFGAEADPAKFNMAHMGLRLAQRSNGVSQLHGRVSRAMFDELWPGFDAAEVPIGSITNGVHGRTWAAPEWVQLGRDLTGSEEALREPMVWQQLQRVDTGHIWWIRSQLRAKLVEDVRRRLRKSWLERGAIEAELGWTETAFDPGVLTIGFARRVPTYKRLTLMLRDPQRLEALLLDESRPLQLIVAGKSHPADDAGKALIQQIVRFADRPEVRHRIAFLPDYDMSMARLLYWGCDVWLNNPLRPLEACGTSGMKSALNGGLNLSIRDGWWDEWFDGENGWEIPSAEVVSEERRDDLESAALYELLQKSVAPKFYDRDENGIPGRWVEMVRHTLQSLGPKVLASRMVRDYTEQYYAPAAASLRRTVQAVDGLPFGQARELAAYRQRVAEAWPHVTITDVDSTGLPDTPLLGSELTLTASVALAGLGPGEVVVQGVLGRVDAGDALSEPTYTDMAHTGSGDGGTEIFSNTIRLPMAGSMGYTVRVLPRNPLLAGPAELGLVKLAGSGGPGDGGVPPDAHL